MAYNLTWYTPEHVLYLELDGQPNTEELQTINQAVTDILDAQDRKLQILIDATNLSTGYQTADQLRETQKYMDDPRLESAIIVADDKLNRLITLMAFCLSRTRLVRFEKMEKTQTYLKRSGFTNAVHA